MEFAELIKTATVEHVQLSCPGLPPVKGTLCVTSHHLLLSSQPGGHGEPGAEELWLLIRNVDAVEKSVQNLGWYQPSRTNRSQQETRFGRYPGIDPLTLLQTPGFALTGHPLPAQGPESAALALASCPQSGGEDVGAKEGTNTQSERCLL